MALFSPTYKPMTRIQSSLTAKEAGKSIRVLCPGRKGNRFQWAHNRLRCTVGRTDRKSRLLSSGDDDDDNRPPNFHAQRLSIFCFRQWWEQHCPPLNKRSPMDGGWARTAFRGIETDSWSGRGFSSESCCKSICLTSAFFNQSKYGCPQPPLECNELTPPLCV